ncbi:hypothetical protein CGW93_00765 [candidate division bacterium WOR-3 4484_18]|uniref:Polymerase nucleotidyl transferase domain-containing protein n=1 Tax=candidate division WOR-3 bacterium 4484_18 TaxID=2020626 RepID=A0A257LVL5_UNCW3|nr:MAG: hypothetical protein CGW93_00765 [candidate division bacterium WOR-3 4484_18]
MGLEAIRVDVRKVLQPYLDKLIAKIGCENIVSIILYGSATGEDYIPGRSDINLLIVVKDIDFGHLRAIIPIVLKGIKRRIPPPLIVHPSYIERSVDVFPIEFLEIRDTRVIIYGEDLLANVEPTREQLRLECEEKIKGQLLTIRSAYIEHGNSPKTLRNLLIRQPPMSRDAVINNVVEQFNLIDADTFRKLLQLRQGVSFTSTELINLFESYHRELEKLADIADSI